MSSRIVRGGAAEPVAWPRWGVEIPPAPDPEGGPLQSEDPPAGTDPASGPPQPEPAPESPPPHDWEAEAAHYAARCAELEAAIPGRVEQARRQGYDDGLARGKEEGARAVESAAAQRAQQQAARDYEDAMSRSAAAAREILDTRARMRKQMEEDLARLAVVVARRILHRELQVDPEALVGIVKAAIDKIEARELHRIVTAPYDAPFVRNRFEELRLPARVEITADPALPRGSLVLETARGHLDSSVETQLREIDRGFADLVRRS